jgi:hypothetical protein
MLQYVVKILNGMLHIVKKALKDFGFGGGHKDMFGGAIKNASLFDEKQIYQRCKDQLGI